MTTGFPFLAETDLHGLVDGYIEPDRRVEALRRLAASPADRARVEAWQGQNDLLRSAFAGIVREPLPPVLDLTAKAQLHCIPANDAPIVAPPGVVEPVPSRRRRVGGAFAAVAVIAAGLWGSWALLDQAGTDDALESATLRGSVDAALVARSSEAVKLAAAAPSAAPRRAAQSLPTTDIPDLHAAGFSFAGADIAAEPMSIVFRYQNGGDERVAVTVAARGRAVDGAGRAAPVRIGNAYSWHKGNKAYAIAGTVRPGRLRALATALQQDDTQ